MRENKFMRKCSFVSTAFTQLNEKKRKKHLKRILLNEVNSSPSQSFRRRIFSEAIHFLHAPKLFISAKGCKFQYWNFLAGVYGLYEVSLL